MSCKLIAGRAAPGLAGVYAAAGLDLELERAALQRALGGCDETLVDEGVSAALVDGEVFRGGEDLAAATASSEIRALERMRGFFTLVAWDGYRQRGLLAVDQVGGRSLYFAEERGRLLFASEVTLLLRLLSRRPGPDEASVVRMLSNNGQALEATLYQGVSRLSAGEYLELASRWSRRTYWSPRYQPPSRLTREEAAERLWEAVVRAVQLRMADTATIGLVMSGGVDSSAVAAAAMEAVRSGGSLPRGYSAVFPGHPHPRVDESERIEQLTGALGLPSVRVHPQPGGALALSLDYLDTWELPLPGAGYLLERPLLELAAADGVTALLDGQGGDELFGLSGYLLADYVRRGRILSSVQLARSYPGIRAQPRRTLLALWRYYALMGAAPHAAHRVARRLRGKQRYVPEFLTPRSARVHVDTDDPWQWKQQSGVPRWWAYKCDMITRERSRIGLGEYLRHRAVLSGLTARPPLLDVDLLEFALQIPPELEFDRAFDRPLIREALRGHVPDQVRRSTLKSNLAPFYFDDLTGPDLEPIRAILRAPDAEIGAYVELDAVRNLVDMPPARGGANWLGWMSTVWCLVVGECWLRQLGDSGFVDRLRETGLPQPKWTVLSRPPSSSTSDLSPP